MNFTICLHRIHKHPKDVDESYHKLHMSVQLDHLLNKLVDLNQYNLENNQQTLVTFDDGWKDVLLIPDDFFLKYQTLQPVIFLTDSQKESFLVSSFLGSLIAGLSVYGSSISTNC